MSGFIRRFGSFPGTDVISQIEGVVIVDTPPPAGVTGVGTGTVACVGEFVDMSNAIAISAAGVITTSCVPVEAFSSQDLINKVGGFDEYLGAFGVSGGNGFCALRNKRFSRLIVAPVDLVTPASTGVAYALRFWRQLPTNTSATNALPIVPVSGATLFAGRQFVNGSSRVRLAAKVTFSSDPAICSGTDGVWLVGASATTQTFESATGAFVTNGVQVGDLLVAGVIDAAGVQGSMAKTYRITAVTDADTIVVQNLDGTAFAATAATAIAWRIHPAAAGDTAGSVAGVNVVLTGTSGYAVPGRPLDATIAAATALTPSVVPTANAANAWDPLSGLAGITHPTGALTYDANVHAVNAAANSTIDSRYTTAIDALLSDDYPARDVNIGFCARSSATINAKGKSHVLTASERGLTRRWINSPPINQYALATILGDTSPGVGINRSERLDYSWPGAQTFVPEAVGFTITCADGTTTDDGILDDQFNGWLACIESNLAPERNPGQAAAPVPALLAPVIGYQRGVTRLGQSEYIQLKQKGIAALRLDRTVGPIVQSGVTTSLTSGETAISRRRMADFIQDSLAQATVRFCKLPLTNALKDAALTQIDSFCNDLLSPNNPSAQRIDSYILDDVSGNTPTLTAAGIHVIIVKVRLTPTGDYFVIQSEIGEGVVTDA